MHTLFTRGAKLTSVHSYRSQPALSQSIRQLEAQLGQKLFESHNRTQLTPFGEFCLPVISELVAHIERASASMLHLGRGEGGILRIAILPSIAGKLLSPLLKSYININPKVNIQILAEDSKAVHHLVASGEVDFGISSLYESDKTLSCSPLLEDRFGILCRSDHPLSKASQSLKWELIEKYTIIGNVMNRQLMDTTLFRYVKNQSIEVSNLPTLLKLIRDGFGISIIPALACPDVMTDLTFIPLKDPVHSRKISLLTKVGRSLSPPSLSIVGLMHDHLHKIFKKNTGLIKFTSAILTK